MSDDCPDCDCPRVTMLVPDALADYTDADALACCPECLRAEPCEAAADGEPEFETIHPRFPHGDNGVAFVLLLQRLDSLALNRADIESLIDDLHATGTDVFMTLDRLREADLEPYLDLGRRREQLEDVVYE
ncbi:hypothetical protein EGH24_09470 [Halonotius terrestris]|uniref:Uncharacterized protein n=1 Tax=Halonotius terrestris TaxID=2487750 RepID=A0A8J8TBV0_9EURY|nr:DUF6276 family protein [Halonotius terrestris]TQQ81337.1 hypothetical protein EGH24_09470 [Halonotius terrestris]